MAEISAKNVVPENFDLRGTTADLAGQIGMMWELIRAPLIAPLLRIAVYICLAMSLMLFFERLYMGIVIVLVKMFWKKPDKRYKWEPMRDDLESANGAFPLVLVQIPMFNEKEVYKISIGAACNLSWPTDRFVIQVLDDSTDPLIKDLVEKECQRWANKGINCVYQIRENRTGYKAGALKEGLKRDYVQECEYVVIFDADFRPEPDFLRRAIPFLVHNPDVALVQARWRFVNSDECLLTRMQEMSLDYHFKVEQEVGSSTHAFFGFNGTGGIWRIKAINEAGGWKDRTTVEDMDLAVRAGLKGWKFVYLGDLQVKSELPSTFKAFRFQQHRWSCGPANLFRKMVMEIVRNKKIKLWKKVYVIYSFFFVRKIIAHMVTFSFYCVVLPLTILVPEVEVPKWGAIYIPCVITALNSVGTPRSIHLLFYWILFENVMSLHRTKATFIGLLEAKRANEWVVTEKLGDALKNKTNAKGAPKRIKFNFGDRIHLLELGFAVFLFLCGCYDFLYGKNNYFIYLFLQVITFTIAGFGYIDKILSSGPDEMLAREGQEPKSEPKQTLHDDVWSGRSIHLLFYWILFENVMSLHRTKATFIGLLEAKRANEWVVTENLGDALKNKTNAKGAPKRIKFNFGDRIHLLELGFAAFLFFCGCYDFLYEKNNYFIYLFLQVITFTIAGFGYIGTIVPT